MALEATHIRFSLDLKDHYKITDLKKYVVGTIYPDSRFTTGVDRKITHPEDFLNNNFFIATDFQKGWFSHLLCDKLQAEVFMEDFSDVLLVVPAGEERWIRQTALKILADMDDVMKFDIQNFLPLLEHGENPNNEDITKILDFNKIFQDMYSDLSKLSIESYYSMWNKLRIDQVLAEKVRKTAEGYGNNKNIMERIPGAYSEMIRRAKI
ncbi:MAG: hypothetical protein WC101_05620 [Candidatus Gracilibacteria bacterium]